MPVVRAGSAGIRTNKKAAHLKRCFFIWDFKAAEKDSPSVFKEDYRHMPPLNSICAAQQQ
jgi:hypothetical protein